MKKLSIITALTVLFTFQTTIAQEAVEAAPATKTEASVDQETYNKVEVEKVSEIIKAAVEKDFNGAIITEAYTDKAGNYKLVIVKDEETKTVFANAKGEWLGAKK